MLQELLRPPYVSAVLSHVYSLDILDQLYLVAKLDDWHAEQEGIPKGAWTQSVCLSSSSAQSCSYLDTSS